MQGDREDRVEELECLDVLNISFKILIHNIFPTFSWNILEKTEPFQVFWERETWSYMKRRTVKNFVLQLSLEKYQMTGSDQTVKPNLAHQG